jgi:hypothetical protein
MRTSVLDCGSVLPLCAMHAGSRAPQSGATAHALQDAGAMSLPPRPDHTLPDFVSSVTFCEIDWGVTRFRCIKETGCKPVLPLFTSPRRW